MSDIVLSVEVRERTGTGGARETRRNGFVPGVLYGGDKGPVSIALKNNEVIKAINSGKFLAQMITIDHKGEKQSVLTRDVQFHPVRDEPVHIDFQRVDESTIITVEVTVHFHNDEKSPGLKRGAVLNVVRHSVEVRCKAGEIPTKFDADLAGLQINDAVKYSMVQVSGNVTPTIVGRDFVIATVTAPSALKRQMMDQAAAAADGDGDAEGGDAEE